MKIGKVLKKYLIPCQENDYKPHFLRSETASTIIILVFVIEMAMIGQALLLADKSDFLAEVLPSVLVDLANSDRTLNSAGTLTVNPKLQEAAQLKANDMAAKGYFAHVTPEGFEPWHWLDQVGYSYTYAGENLAVNFFDSIDVEKAWMASPTHRQNLVKPQYTEVGIAMAPGIYKGQNTIFVVQFFGAPKVLAAAVPVPVSTGSPQVTATPIAKVTPVTIAKVTPTVAPTVSKASPIPTATQIAQVKAAETSNVRTPSPSLIRKILSSPRTTDKYLLYTLLIITCAALALAVIIEIRVQHKHIIANGLGLIVVIGLGFIINSRLFSEVVTVTTMDETTASVINIIPQN
jgi:hypothetical protein